MKPLPDKYPQFLQKSPKFIFITLVSICVTRILVIVVFYLLGTESPTAQNILQDRWHHYQLGLLLMIGAWLLRRQIKTTYVLPLSFGIFLEEWAVVLDDLGFNTVHLYLSQVDFIIVVVAIGLIYLISTIIYAQQAHTKI